MSGEQATPAVRFYGSITQNQLTKAKAVKVTLSVPLYPGLIDSLLALEDKELGFSIVARQFQPRLMEDPKPERPKEGCIHPFEKRGFRKDQEVCQECGTVLGTCRHKLAENGVCEYCGEKPDDSSS